MSAGASCGSVSICVSNPLLLLGASHYVWPRPLSTEGLSRRSQVSVGVTLWGPISQATPASGSLTSAFLLQEQEELAANANMAASC